MKEQRYPYRIAILEFLLVLTSLGLTSGPTLLLEAQAKPFNSLSELNGSTNHLRVDHNLGGNLVEDHHRAKTIPELPALVEQPSLVSSLPENLLVDRHNATNTQRLQRVVHETNKVILLTNGEFIKLYPLRERDLTPSGGYYVIKSKLNITANGWQRPLISDVDYLFDERFCTSSDQPWIRKSNCLVLFWLDKRNKFLHYGSFTFTHSSRIELLSSKFNPHDNLKSLSDKNKKSLWLDELHPIDLCKRAKELDYHLIDCEVSGMHIDRTKKEIQVFLDISVATTSANSLNKKLMNATMTAYIGKTSLDFQTIDTSLNPKESEIPDAIAMTISYSKCQSFWLNANYELYMGDLGGRNAQLMEKLSPRPAIRMLGTMHSYRDILFFSDLPTRSIMSYNITQRTSVIRRQGSLPETKVKNKFGMVPKLDSTHQVLLVESPSIESFNIIDLSKSAWRTDPRCSKKQPKSFEEPRVIDDNLTDHLKKQKLYSDNERHLFEDILQMTLILLSILLILLIVTDQTRVKQVKSDRETIVDHAEP